MEKQQVIDAVLRHKIIAILRGFDKTQLPATVAALEAGGVGVAEVTFDSTGATPDAAVAEAIADLAARFAGRVQIGAGTVLTPRQVDLAAQAGAKLILSPDCNPAVIRRTCERGLVSIPGALTPTEVMTAQSSGADFVKLFPAASLGVDYLRALRAPLSQVRFLAVGGVTVDNLADFLRAGACGVGIGSNLADRKSVQAGDFAAVTRSAQQFVRAAGL